MRPMAISMAVSLAFAVLLLTGSVLAQDRKNVLTGHPDAVQVMLPSGTVTVSYVEAAEGMMVYVTAQEVTVKARKLFLGDGRIAVKFEARHDGFFTPAGKPNVAGLTYESGAIIKFNNESRQAWASEAGVVYVLTPDITFEPKSHR
jgi:hypothetical protein